MTTVHTAPRLGLLMALALAAPALVDARDVPTTRDIYGYSQMDSAGDHCPHTYIDMTSATPLLLVPGHGSAAVDDRAAQITLDEDFELYSLPSSQWVVSANGYMALAGSFAEDDGSDFSNDCPLPALPDNPAASQDRIYVYHDDLQPRIGSVVRQAHFASCPRPADTQLADQSCSVVEWVDFDRRAAPGGTPITAQVVLYHATHEIVLQYASVDASFGSSATVGVQGFDSRSGKTATCNVPGAVQPAQSICLFDPRHRQAR